MILANYMLEFAGPERIWFVVSPHNPLKEKSTLLADHHRMQLVRLAVEGHSKMKASKIEFGLPQPSYTVNTLAHLTEKYPEHTFSLIMGSDNLESLPKWKNYQVILEHHKLLVYPRAGSDGGSLKNNASVIMTAAPCIEVSASFLREAIRTKKDLRYFFPEAVWEYILAMGFYKKQ